jgi:hypothetical protein
MLAVWPTLYAGAWASSTWPPRHVRFVEAACRRDAVTVIHERTCFKCSKVSIFSLYVSGVHFVHAMKTVNGLVTESKTSVWWPLLTRHGRLDRPQETYMNLKRSRIALYSTCFSLRMSFLNDLVHTIMWLLARKGVVRTDKQAWITLACVTCVCNHYFTYKCKQQVATSWCKYLPLEIFRSLWTTSGRESEPPAYKGVENPAHLISIPCGDADWMDGLL